MNDKTTGAMQQLGRATPSGPSGIAASPGLVLLYAERFNELPAAWPLAGQETLIGRDEQAGVQIDVPAVSRRHAQVRYQDGAYVLTDLGSRNGTFVDGQRISEIVLEPAHEIRIGDCLLKFVERDADQMSQYRLDGTRLSGSRQHRANVALLGGYQLDRIVAELERIAPTELSVMVLGESGTGKEVVARELHRMSGRPGHFAAVNCAAIPATLIESELFGYKKGAFSGAERDKPGIIRSAHDGTLLLDEIGDMPLEAQAKLLRVLQAKEIYPVGATHPERVNVRIVCATHRDLGKLQELGKFRQDLFARLNEYQVKLPALREHKEDIYQLVRAFLTQNQRANLRVSFAFMTGLVHYDWPYNVRELEACIKRSSALCDKPVLEEEYLTDPVKEAMADYGRLAARGRVVPLDGDAGDLRQAPSETELRALLQTHQGNIAAVGRVLGKARMQVHRWLDRYAIDVADYR